MVPQKKRRLNCHGPYRATVRDSFGDRFERQSDLMRLEKAESVLSQRSELVEAIRRIRLLPGRTQTITEAHRWL